jgi:molybdopterin-binding protein
MMPHEGRGLALLATAPAVRDGRLPGLHRPQELADGADRAAGTKVAAHSARNRLSGLVTRVVRDTLIAQVEIQAGPNRFVSLLSREAADELALEPGMLAIATVKATNACIEIPETSQQDR